MITTPATFGRLAAAPEWELAAARYAPELRTPECDALVAVASRPEMTEHDLDCAVLHDRMLSRRLRLDAA